MMQKSLAYGGHCIMASAGAKLTPTCEQRGVPLFLRPEKMFFAGFENLLKITLFLPGRQWSCFCCAMTPTDEVL